jgi:hypothetical protein
LRDGETQRARRRNGPAEGVSRPRLIRALRTSSVALPAPIPCQTSRPIPRLLACLLACVALFSSDSLVAQSKPSEYSVKAAYLLNFGRFMRVSPGGITNPKNFNICIVGEDPFGTSLDSITAGEVIDGRPVRVVHLNKPDLEKPDFAKSDARQCAIAFLSISEEKRMEQDLAAFKDSDTLTVSDAPDFLKRGGMIQLVPVSNHIRFSVNLDPVRRTHLNLSSELLRVAASVSGNRPGEVQQ